MAPKTTQPKDDDDKTQKTEQAADQQAPPADGDELPIPTEIQE